MKNIFNYKIKRKNDHSKKKTVCIEIKSKNFTHQKIEKND